MNSHAQSKKELKKSAGHKNCCHKDAEFMERALELAAKGMGETSPNPMVGAVVVKNNKIIGEGYHKRAGMPHAETLAIKEAGRQVKGSTLYVTLEPCCHVGRTGPCVERIIKEKVKRVVIAAPDPNPLVNGKGVVALKHAGVKVDVGVSAQEAVRLNEIFFKNMRRKMPFVAAKVAQSLDGKITANTGESQWITGAQARIYAKKLRDKYDAVLVGINTVLKDNPRLNGLHKIGFKVVIDPKLRMPVLSKLVTQYSDKLIVVTGEKNAIKKNNLPAILNIVFVKQRNGVLDIKEMLQKLYMLGITSMFVEGGAQTLGYFFDAKAIDKIYFFIAPKIIGGKNSLSSIGALGAQNPNKSTFLKDRSIEFIGEDILVTAYPV
jgi:diaminohydroxyphosphoribosylaminopyrimidine deaminase/5-amino-6-(5-phosphoribosylamino)uracil reductase